MYSAFPCFVDQGETVMTKLLSGHPVTRSLFGAIVLSVLAIAAVCFVNACEWINKPFAGFLVNKRMVLGDVGQYHWSGTRAGLKYPDKILIADGRYISTIKDLESVVREKSIGDSVAYTVERDGNIRNISIPTVVFTITDFLLIFGTSFSAGLIYLFIAVIVFILKPDTKVSWVFFLFGTLLGVFSIILFDVQSTHTWLTTIYILSAGMFPATAVHLSFLFPAEKGFVKRHPRLQYIPYLISGILALSVVVTYPSVLSIKLYKVIVICWVIAALCLLLSALHALIKKTTAIARQRAKVVLLGVAIAFPIPAISETVTYHGGSFGGIRVLDNFLIFPLILFPASIAYAIARHNLFEVDVFIKRAVGYAIMTALVGAGYFSIQVLLKSFVLAPVFGDQAEKVAPLVFSLLVVFLFNPLNRRIQGAVDRLFYRKKFDYKVTVVAVSDALSSVLNLDEIVRKIVGTVRQEMFIDRSGLILMGHGGVACRGYFMGVAEGEQDDVEVRRELSDEIRETDIPCEDPLVVLLSREKKLLTRYDIAEDPRYAAVREPCGKRFAELGANLAIPVLYQGEVKGILAVGHKKSGHFYTREDVELLQTLASHGAVAIENANLAEQMKKEETVRTNLSRYLSPQIVDRIVKHDVQVNLGGDRKIVTVLFSDIRNFTTITESRPPDQLVRILNEYFTEMAAIIFDQQGSLDKYIGDAIVAVFGSLVKIENPAGNTVAAAVTMMKRLPELNREWESRFGFSMSIGIGINTGEVFLGNIGSPERMEFTVIGDAVNVASRFSGLAKPGQILVTRDTLGLLGPDVATRALPPAQVKGKSDLLEVYEIVY